MMLGGISLALMAEMYETMDDEGRADIRQSLDEMDEVLQQLEKQRSVSSNITKLEEIRTQRQQIQEFKRLIA